MPARYPTLTALRVASQSRIERTVKARSPRVAAKVSAAVAAALTVQDVTVPAEAAALICLARRCCDVILAMLRTGQPYQPGRPAPGLPRAA